MAERHDRIDAAAEKAFAEAAERKTAEAVSPKAVAEAVEADTPAPIRSEAIAQAVAAPAAKAAPRPTAAKKTTGKTAAKRASAKKLSPNKPAARRAAKPVAPAAKPAVAEIPTPLSQLKDIIMATAENNATTDYTAQARELAADVQTRAKAAYEKGTAMTKDAVEFQKGNFEALVEAGKILAGGMQNMGRAYVEDAKGAVETVQADVKKFAAIKSPTELFQLQGEIARRNFDAAVANASKNTEAMIKLANEAFAPVSNRMSLAAEKVSTAA